MTRNGPAARMPWWRPLHVRVALVVVPLLALLCTAMLALLHHYSAQAALEATQRTQRGLAAYVVAHQAPGLIHADGRPDNARMQDLAMHVMTINPSVEVYLLDLTGRVLAHALDGVQGNDPVGRSVDLAPVRALLAGDAQTLPVWGTDPRDPAQPNIISVAAVGGAAAPDGYLYIVLNGQAVRGVAASLANSEALRALAIGLALCALLAGAVMVLALHKLTRPLRELTSEVSGFRSDSPVCTATPRADEVTLLRAAFHALQQRIAQQFEHLEASDRQRRELVSNISHDLRTPLSSIQGYVETVLLRGTQMAPDTRAQHLRTALRHVTLLGQRIGDLFELSKLDAGRMAPRLEVFCLAELLQDVVQNYQLAAQQRKVRLLLAAGSHSQARVAADIALIERVLQNLIDNALRHTAAGGEVTLGLTARGAQLEISVSDTGMGIAQDHLPHIFERYWRAPQAHGGAEMPATGHSAGLGLAIVKRILDLHGSVVRVQSEISRGTCFAFVLPHAA